MPPFCGREDLLATLLARWQEVKGGEGPRAVVLLAESGLGKTRLAQELYARLVELEQADGGYWPPELGTDGNNLLVNPPSASWNAAADVPFLWWGVRLSDQVGRNQVATGALAAHVDSYLVPHLEPFHREQRRRQRLGQLAKVGGAVAVDAVLDLVPFLGLLKKAGEVGLELKGIHDTWRRDRQTLDAASLLTQRRDSLVDQLIDDLGKLFGGAGGRTVPAVIFVDDAQFSRSDPGVTAFVQALLSAMTEGDWPLLLLIAHWEREFVEAADVDADGSVAAVVSRHAELVPDQVEVLRLKPITGLEPMVTERLPGLPDWQVARLTERAGGNPQYLDEILLLAMDPRSRAWFEQRSLQNALTDAGIETLLSKSVKLHDVVAERFASVPEPVQRAVALAGAQGTEFLQLLVAFVHQRLTAEQDVGDEVLAALEEARERHGYVAWLGEGQGAFSQRIYQEVAKDFLPAYFDELEVEAALRAVVSQIMLGELPLELPPAGLQTLMGLTVGLFEDSVDEEERRLAAHGLHILIGATSAAGELQVARQLALRQAALLESLSDARLDADLGWLRATNEVLASVGDVEARRSVLIRLVRLTGETYDDDVNSWSASLYAQVLLDVAEFHEEAGAQELRAEALDSAVAVVQSLDGFEADADLLEASLRLHRTYAAWFEEHGRMEAARETRNYSLEVARRLALDGDPVRRLQLATVQGEIGANAVYRGDAEAAVADLEQATLTLRELAAGGSNVELEIRLAGALDHLSEAYAASGRQEEAETLLVEVLAMMRRHLGIAPEAPRTISNVADSLEKLAIAQRRRGANDAAWQHAKEAVELRRAVAERSGALPDFAMLGYSLVRAGEIALALGASALGASALGASVLGASAQGASEEGHALVTEALRLLRQICESDTSARAAWRLLLALKVALDFELQGMRLATAQELLAEVDEVKARLDPDALQPMAPYLRDIEERRARVLEQISQGRNDSV